MLFIVEFCFREHFLLTVMQPCTLFPSVRCGLEMAILNAIANRKGSNLLGILHPQIVGDIFKSSSTVQICALVDSSGTPTQVADAIATLVEEGFTAVKIKVLLSCNSKHHSYRAYVNVGNLYIKLNKCFGLFQ